MSESGDSGPGRREVAHRLFAAEFDDADFSYSESDEERAPNYVVTPTGARVNRLFLVGVLTELEQVNDDVLRARVVDPTGPFVVYAGQYQPDELAFLEAADPPMFVAVTGKARTFQPDDSDRVFTSVRPESISEVDADTRDRWVVQAAEQTVSRIGRMASAKQAGLAGDELRLALLDQGIDESAAAGITLALDHYGTTGDYLDALRTTALDAARVVAGDTDEAEGLSLSPDDGTDDPIPLLASLDLDTDVSTPETTTDETGMDTMADEPAAESEVSESTTETTTETTADEPAAEPSMETASDDATAETTIDEEPTVSETPSGSESETVANEPETSTTASASEPEPSSGAEGDLTDDTFGDGESGTDTAEPEATTSTAADTGTAEADEDLGEFDPEFELDEDEREEIEQEYGTAFQTGTEVDEPGEAGIETPDPDEEVPAEADTGTEVDSEPETEPASATESEPASESEPEVATETAPSTEEDTSSSAAETTAEPAAESDEDDDSGAEPAEDVDLEDAVMEVMEDLDDGSGADREELLAAVVDRYGADADAVDDAIQDALMGGRCYEPDDGKLTPI
ncbi:hypothetical protein [Haloarcula sp. CGMCC 1.6347]|uniref:hypothetical protein n=1 Tax=Haloarcula sp. CGMCC 1.6347 TaxID=3111455 RepID=UPI00300F526A